MVTGCVCTGCCNHVSGFPCTARPHTGGDFLQVWHDSLLCRTLRVGFCSRLVV